MSTTPDEAGLRAAEEARRQAMLANDGAALGALLADALVYTHSNGGKDSKPSYLQRLASGALHYERVEFESPHFQVIGTVGCVTASMQATVTGGPGRREVSNSYLAVWEHTASGWKLLFLQGTPAPAAAH
ncbi:MAG: nuclear transport factor 2 family protein [Polaromonas sp.]|nr:nuclear transport factor 2 family protein [Polaromonas sp.]